MQNAGVIGTSLMPKGKNLESPYSIPGLCEKMFEIIESNAESLIPKAFKSYLVMIFIAVFAGTCEEKCKTVTKNCYRKTAISSLTKT